MAESRARPQVVADHEQCRRCDVPREPLWRQLLGGQIRSLRHERGETLAETAGRAGVSTQYLSEVERGLKEPSSEVIAALARALDVTLLDLTLAVANDIHSAHSSTVTTNTVTTNTERTAGSGSVRATAPSFSTRRGPGSPQAFVLAA